MLDRSLRLAVDHRVLVMVLVLLSAALGLWNFQRLPIDAVPDITNVQVQINTEAPGYTPLETERRITWAIETAMAGMPQLNHTRSLSRYGLSQVTVVFADGTDLYFARAQVAERLNAARAQLPAGIEPALGPIATGLGEIFLYTVEADPGRLPAGATAPTPMQLRSLQDWVIRPQLLRVPGVAEINAVGGDDKEILVAPDPARLQAHGLSFADLAARLNANNGNQGAGSIEKNGSQLLVRVPGQAETLDDLRRIVVSQSDGVPLRIGDVATVSESAAPRSGAATLNGDEVVLGTAIMRVGENSRTVARAVAARLPAIAAGLPPGVRLTPVYDRTTLVDRTLATVEKNLAEGALLVVAILFALLGNVRAALLTAAVIPFAMLITISGMVGNRVSANLMSLGALDFGLIVDGAVIIVENALRRLAEASHGDRRLPLAERLDVVFRATREVIRPALFGVMIITAVYLPLFALEGVEGRMFHPMAATVVIALLAGMLLALSFIPAGIALLFRAPVRDAENPLLRLALRAYRPLLDAALRQRRKVAPLALLLVLGCAVLATRLGSEFVPNLDEGDAAIQALRIPGTSLGQSLQLQRELEREIAALPEVERVFARLGTAEVATDPMPPNIADGYVMLKPRAQWPDPGKPKAAVMADIEARAGRVPGSSYELSQPIQLRFNELISGVRSDLGVKVYGDDLDTLARLAADIARVLQGLPGAADVRAEPLDGLPLLTVTPDREQLSRFGLNVADVQAVVAGAIGGQAAGRLFEGDARYDIVLRLPEALRSDVDALTALPVPLPGGGSLPLAEVATVALRAGPNQINRENGKRRAVVTANVRGRDLGSFVADAQRRLAADVPLPTGYWLDYGGSFEQLQSAATRLALVVPATLALILAMLWLAFGSLRDALVIFSGVPLALTGGVLALWLHGIPLSISAGVGFIALSGIAVLNGLVMVSFIRDLLARGRPLDDAIAEGALSRLRPVLMTALVASLGFVPMAFNTGIGSEVQRPLATVVIGGIGSSTLLTLLVLPALYRLAGRARLPRPATSDAATGAAPG
jgi:cobalt-zinc-cadmium resistance protein CzcA